MRDLEKVAVLENEVQARRLEGVLKAQNIPHIIRSYHDSVYNGLYQVAKGWGVVEAPPAFKEKILKIIADISSESSKESE